MAVVAALSFFGSILLHEVGHALAARREGIDVAGIDLFLFGGVMRMNRDTDSPAPSSASRWPARWSRWPSSWRRPRRRC